VDAGDSEVTLVLKLTKSKSLPSRKECGGGWGGPLSLEENYEQLAIGVIAAAACVFRILHRIRR
jgi:hypothetical protein